MRLIATLFAGILALCAVPALACEQTGTAVEVNAALQKAGLPYRACSTISIEMPGAASGTPGDGLDLDAILSAVFPGIEVTVVQTGSLNYVEMTKGGKKARTGIGSGTIGELITRMNGIAKYLSG